jgi:hypothetical protein
MYRALAGFLFVMLCTAGLAAAQETLTLQPTTLSSEKELQALSEKALDRLMRGDAEGFELLRRHSVEMGSQETLDRFFRSQTDAVKKFVRKWGKPLGYELIARPKVGDSFCRYVYLAKYENNFLRWVFTYYRPKQGWLFFRLDFDDNVNALFEDARGAASGGPTTVAPKAARPADE